MDLLAQRSSRTPKRFDVALPGFGGRVRTVIEFKQPNATVLGAFREELFEEYVRPQLALLGVFTNGIEFVLSSRTNGEFTDQFSVRLPDLGEEDAAKIEHWLSKKKVQDVGPLKPDHSAGSTRFLS